MSQPAKNIIKEPTVTNRTVVKMNRKHHDLKNSFL